VHHTKGSLPDDHLPGRVMEIKPIRVHCRLKRDPFLIIISKHARHWHFKRAKNSDGFGLGDIASMNNAINLGVVEQLNNSAAVF
jgi:hypothetical protein